jgi:uncharacterized protein YjgD (DUF1641 family)
MVVVKRKVNEKYEERLSNLKDRFQELKEEVSELRKKGFNTEIVEVLLYDFAPRIKMAKVTYDEFDIERINNLFKNIEEELEIVKNGSDFTNVLKGIEEAYEMLRTDKYSEASKKYHEIIEKYKKLPQDQKRFVYVPSMDLWKKIRKKG